MLLASGVQVAAADPGAPPAELLFQDSFAGKLADGWSWEREDAAHWRTGPSGLEVRVQPGNMWGPSNNAKNVLLRPIPEPLGAPVEISVSFSNAPTAQWEQANLVWFYDDGNMVKLGQELVTGRLSIVMGREQGDSARTVAIVPLDDNTVELRLQAFNNRVRGQCRTAPWRRWRDIGECDLPVKGAPKASLHFYNGPASEEHWVRASHFNVRRLSALDLDWPRTRTVEVSLSAATSATNKDPITLELPGGFQLMSLLRPLRGDPKADFEQKLFRNKDGSYGWNWDRRASSSKEPIACGAGWGACGGEPPNAARVLGPDIAAFDTNSIELACDAVTRLENDHGDHNLAAVIFLSDGSNAGTPATRRLVIEFDWYGNASDKSTLNDGFRDYGSMPVPPGSTDIRYRLKGFRGSPPRVNLKAFVDAAAKLQPQSGTPSRVVGVWFGNEIGDGSRGGTLVTALDLVVNGKRFSSAAPATSK